MVVRYDAMLLVKAEFHWVTNETADKRSLLMMDESEIYQFAFALVVRKTGVGIRTTFITTT